MQRAQQEQSDGSGSRPIVTFPMASQPELMRAAEKDEQYIGYLSDACYDAFRHAFGTRHAATYQNETKMAARVLYYLLTTGAGLQTLGEEYCDISQVSSTSGLLRPSPARRFLLIFYQNILPYLGDRLSTRAATRGIMLASQDTLEISNEVLGSSRHNGIRILDRLQRAWTAALVYWPTLLPLLRESTMLVIRANLMLFYFEGIYYYLSNRAAKIHHIFLGKPSQQKPRYRVLGMLLLVQLFIVGGDWIRRSILPLIVRSMQCSRPLEHAYASTGYQGIAVLDEDGNQVSTSQFHSESSSLTRPVELETTVSKCPLCLSKRQSPTSTPCGHVFCWTCVAEWCNEKPECPLCRAPISHSELVCVYHSDF